MEPISIFGKSILRKLPWTLSASGLLLVAAMTASAQNTQQQDQQQANQQGQTQQSGDAPQVFVEQQPPQVQVQQPQPKVTAEQKKMQVDVQTGEPQVSVQQPQPEVRVEQPEPEVSIQQAEPRVIVENAEPQVEVHQAKPEVTVNRAEPQIRVISEDRSGRRTEQQIQASNRADFQQGQGQQAQSQQGQQNQQQARLMNVPLEQLKNLTVQTSQGEELGNVEDIVVNNRDGRAGFVVSTGGVLGLGGQEVFIPASEAELYGDSIIWQTSQNAEQIGESSQYQPDQFTSVADAQGTLNEARNAVTQRAER